MVNPIALPFYGTLRRYSEQPVFITPTHGSGSGLCAAISSHPVTNLLVGFVVVVTLAQHP